MQELFAALLSGDLDAFGSLLSELVVRALSYHDVGHTPERIYHAFLTGVLVSLEPDYDVRSNRESGHGRYDLMLCPRTPGRPGVVLELKTLEPGRTPDQLLDAALARIRARDYSAELRARGANPIREVAAAFDGKRVHVRGHPT